MLSLQAATVRFGERAALDAVDLEVADHRIVCLLGPSGSGKSTLLRAVAGLQPMDGGRVLLAGQDQAGVPVHRRGLGLMFQDHQLFPHRDVGSNVGFGLRMHGTGRAGTDARVRELLELVGLPGAERRAVAALSGGEQQRVALARALAQGARVLLMDEPFAALDAITRDVLHDELTRIWAEHGLTVLFVTHNVSEAVRLGGRVVLLSSRPGRIAREWSVDLPQPRSLEPAGVAALSSEITEHLRGEIRRHVVQH